MPVYHVYLADFGLARVMSNTTVMGTKTMLAGTPGYQSPEQLKGESVGLSSDVYAFGGVLLTLFGGKPLWPGLSHYQIMYRVTVAGETPSVEGVQPVFIQSVCSLSFRNVHSRPSINQILEMLLKASCNKA